MKKKFFDLEPEFFEIYEEIKKYSMLSVERMYANYKAIEYICQAGIEGDIVVCGVWRGGSSMIMAKRLKQLANIHRKIFLYDTYTGMSEPTAVDKDFNGKVALAVWKDNQKADFNEWAYASLADVKKNLSKVQYPMEKIEFIQGKVEETIPKNIPDKIALLRLDTDWHESTMHELTHLYPRLVKGGVLIIDDYGHWKGAREAVDEYFKKNNISILLNRTDYTGRMGIKI